MGSKPLGGSKGDIALHPFEIDQISPGISGNVVVKGKWPPRSGFVALRQLNPIHKKGP